VSEQGGWTSHTAILARSLNIPAVVGVDHVLEQVHSGDTVVVDGDSGTVILCPSRDVLREYHRRQRPSRKTVTAEERSLMGKLHTSDGQRIFLQANTELPHEIGDVTALGVDGVGLFRSEFLLLQSKTGVPTEEEQFEAFKMLAMNSSEQPPAVRIFDIGAEKFAGTAGIKNELNPALGLRGIRLCLAQPDFFRAHLRAILRASAFGRLRVVVPFVSDLGEVRATRKLMLEAISDLSHGDSGIQPPPLGVMIELPSAVHLIQAFARESDFLCVGTNDLIQYTMAVDRTNRNVAGLFQPLHPAVLQSLKKIIDAGQQHGRAVTLCGEAACEPLFAYITVGMGVSNFSINRNSIPRLKRAIPQMLFAEAQMAAMEILRLEDLEQVLLFLQAQFRHSSSQHKRAWYQEWQKAQA
jgi:phosphotransferase system enzyme I (PtsI)